MKNHVIVVGAGAGGILAALRAAECGAKVTLIEKTSRIGTKILISGGGKCNIAHEGPLEDVIRAFRPNEARFIRPSVYRLTNKMIIEMFTSRGLEVYTRDDGRVFPVYQTAKDVVAILRDYLDEARVKVVLNTPVEEILVTDGKISGVRTGQAFEKNSGYRSAPAKVQFGAKALLAEVLRDVGEDAGLGEQVLTCDRVVVAVGGSSYPNSGTTGDGWPWMKNLGHSVEKITAALAPVYLELEPFDPEKSGVALRDIILKARQSGKEIARWRNDLLFTHQGVSGPTVLGISRVIAERAGFGDIQLFADLAPDQDVEQLTSQIESENIRKLVSNWLADGMAERNVIDVMRAANVPADMVFGRLDKKSRNRLTEVLKAFPLGRVRTVPIEKGEVCAGGVALSEVDPQSMRSLKVQGLYLCGEILDIAGPVGGYNLQSAFATGYVAGESAAKDEL
jgi:predicted flavoprotein YhiN